MTNADEHLRSRLETWLGGMDEYLAARVAGQADPRQAEILAAAAKEKDPAWADFLREHVEVRRIRTVRDLVKFRLECGDLAGAERARERWENARSLVQQIIDSAHIRRSRKIERSARLGHEATHGTEEEKFATWSAIARDFEAEIRAGTKKTAARAIIAERHGVSIKTVQRAVKRLSKS